MQVTPYLFFNGRCEEALDFYKQAVGAQVRFQLRYSEAPEPPDPNMVPPDQLHKICHVSFAIGESELNGSDGCPVAPSKFEGFALSLTPKDAAEAERLFVALSEGGQVRMPLAKTFFSPAFGMLADKFGVGWMIYVPQPM